MAASKGAYALLLGSGASRDAGIPTGWEVTLELARRIDPQTTADMDTDALADWYRKSQGREPDYSEIIGGLGVAPTDRRALLAGFFEPTEAERSEGRKVPSRGHEAIARLVSSGHIRVIVTTNFDRLIETALEAAGVSPQVISTPDQAEGATVLHQAECTVVKVHGDYRDTRIRNVSAELDAYDRRTDSLLDRIFDEYGLIVCGWSGEWDRALRDALDRSASRRYGTYWTARGPLGGAAAEVAERIDARGIRIDTASGFFSDLEERVVAIERLGRDPLDGALTLQALKRYLPRPEYRIDLEELVRRETGRLQGCHADVANVWQQPDEYLALIERLFDCVEPALRVLLAGVYWGESIHERLWTHLVDRALNHPHRGAKATPDVHRLPALLMLYTIACGALLRGDAGLLHRIMRDVSLRIGSFSPDSAYVDLDHRKVLAPGLIRVAYRPEDPDKFYVYPASQWLRSKTDDVLSDLVVEAADRTRTLDEAEYLLAMLVSVSVRKSRDPSSFPDGLFVTRHPDFADEWEDPTASAQAKILHDLRAEGEAWPLVASGAFNSAEEAETVSAHVNTECRQIKIQNLR